MARGWVLIRRIQGDDMGKKADKIRDEVQRQIEAEQVREKRWIEIEKRRHRCFGCVWVRWADTKHPVCLFGQCVKGRI